AASRGIEGPRVSLTRNPGTARPVSRKAASASVGTDTLSHTSARLCRLAGGAGPPKPPGCPYVGWPYGCCNPYVGWTYGGRGPYGGWPDGGCPGVSPGGIVISHTVLQRWCVPTRIGNLV